MSRKTLYDSLNLSPIEKKILDNRKMQEMEKKMQEMMKKIEQLEANQVVPHAWGTVPIPQAVDLNKVMQEASSLPVVPAKKVAPPTPNRKKPVRTFKSRSRTTPNSLLEQKKKRLAAPVKILQKKEEPEEEWPIGEIGARISHEEKIPSPKDYDEYTVTQLAALRKMKCFGYIRQSDALDQLILAILRAVQNWNYGNLISTNKTIGWISQTTDYFLKDAGMAFIGSKNGYPSFGFVLATMMKGEKRILKWLGMNNHPRGQQAVNLHDIHLQAMAQQSLEITKQKVWSSDFPSILKKKLIKGAWWLQKNYISAIPKDEHGQNILRVLMTACFKAAKGNLLEMQCTVKVLDFVTDLLKKSPQPKKVKKAKKVTAKKWVEKNSFAALRNTTE